MKACSPGGKHNQEVGGTVSDQRTPPEHFGQLSHRPVAPVSYPPPAPDFQLEGPGPDCIARSQKGSLFTWEDGFESSIMKTYKHCDASNAI